MEKVKCFENGKGVIVIPITGKIRQLGDYRGKDWHNLFLNDNLEKDVIQTILSDSFNDCENPLEGKKEIIILKDTLFNKREVEEEEIYSLAKKMKLTGPHPKIACITRAILSNEQIEQDLNSAWVTCMHKPVDIKSENGSYAGRLSVDADGFVSVKYNKKFRGGHSFSFVS